MKILLLLLLTTIYSLSVFPQTESVTPISPNQKVEREIKLDEQHIYSFSLNENEFVRFEIEHKNVNPLLTVSSTDGKILHQLYFDKAVGRTAISFLSAEKADFRLTVKPSGRARMNGSYNLLMTTPRPVAEIDSQRIEAEKVLTGNAPNILKATKSDSFKLTAEQRKKRIESLQKILSTWQRVNDSIFEQETHHQIGQQAKSVKNLELVQSSFEKVLQMARMQNDLADEAWALFHLGDLAENRGEIETAQKNFLRANELAEKSGARVLETEMLNRLAVFYRNRSQFEKAKDALQKMLIIYQSLKSEVDEAKAKVSLALVLNDIDARNDKTSVMQEALKVFEKNEAFYEKANILRMLGSNAADAGKFAEAEKYLTESLALMEKHGEPSDEAFILYGLGLLKIIQGKFAEATQLFNTGLNKLGDNVNSSLKINLLTGLARVEISQGKIIEGLNRLKTTAQIADKLKIPKEQIEVTYILSSLYLAIGQNGEALKNALYAKKISDETKDKVNLAKTLNILGRIYHLQGNYPQAVALFEETIKLAEENKEPRVTALGYQTLGELYDELRDFQRAEKNILKATEIFEKSTGNLDKLLAAILLAQVYLNQNKIAEAKAKLLEIFEKNKTVKNALVEARAHQLFGYAVLQEKNFAEASQRFNTSLTMNSQSKAAVGIALALKGMGDSLLGAGNLVQAQTIYGQTLGIFRQISSPTGEAAIFEKLMELESNRGNRRLAIYYGKQSVALRQNIRGSIKPLEAEIRKSFLTSVESAYRTLAAILIEENRLAEAQQIIGLLKEEEFYQFTQRNPDSVSVNQVDFSPVETQAVAQYKGLTDRITTVTTRVTQLELEKRAQPLSPEKQAEMQKLQTELVALNGGYVKYVQDLSVAFSQSDSAKTEEISTSQTQNWQKRLAELNQEAVLLTTLVADDKYYVIATTPTTQFARQVTITNAELNANINKLREVLEEPRTKATTAAQELYDILVKPLEADLAQNKTKKILWSLDGTLRYVPVAALFDGEKYLVEKYTNSVVTLAQSPFVAGQPIDKWKGLGVGVSDEIKGFEPLPHVSAELKNIIRDETVKNEKGLFGGKRLLNRDFTKQNLQNSLKQKFQFVHFATHFVFNPGKDVDSYLLLGDGNRLTLAEMRSDESFDLNGVELLTLSACETGLDAQNADGAEIESLGVIAQKRGAKSVITTLWSISDNATPQVMSEFYRNYKNGKVSKAEAMRQAQLSLLKKGKTNQNYSHPAYWASFVVVGEWR
jgi:CHAT domain-containing protein/tetratricopeptide (TPR) repeat protein